MHSIAMWPSTVINNTLGWIDTLIDFNYQTSQMPLYAKLVLYSNLNDEIFGRLNYISNIFQVTHDFLILTDSLFDRHNYNVIIYNY